MDIKKQDKKFLKIKTGVKMYSAIFIKVYVIQFMEIDLATDKAVIDLKTYNRTRTNHVIHKSKANLLDKYTISLKDFNFKKLISKLALKYDASLNFDKATCIHEKKSIKTVQDKLTTYIAT